MSYQIVIDESVDYALVKRLRLRGFNVFSITEELPSLKDEYVPRIAYQNNALLITEDKDFGELVFLLHKPHKWILLIRIKEKTIIIDKIVETIKSHFEEMLDHFSILTADKLRTRQ